MYKIKIVLWVLGAITFFKLADAVAQVPDKFEVECNFTSIGAQWRKSCNWCRCSETGQGLCTRRGCPPGLEVRLQEEKECMGDAQWKKDCNWCSCVNERAICTSKFCGELPSPLPRIQIERKVGRSLNDEPECVAVSKVASFRRDCNWCRCANNSALCTKKFCRPGTEKSTVAISDCNGELMWKRGCERCECVDGFSVCIPEGCSPAEKEMDCVAGSEGGRWRKDCNWCTCGNGLSLCTRRGCLPGASLKEEDPQCEGDITWKKDCNFCRCVDGQAKCSKHTCGPDSEIDQKCKNGQTWVEGCNNCFCNAGSSFCTKRACVDAPMNDIQPAVLGKRVSEVSELMLNPKSNSGMCKDGSRWMKECNWCTCSNGTGVCTLRGCLPGFEKNLKAPFCDEESQWNEDCNICKCAKGYPVCTKIGCRTSTILPPSVTNAPANTPKREVNKEIRCTVGSRWKDECNWCNCANEFSPFCTLIGCLPGFKNEGPVCEVDSQWRHRDGSWCNCVEGQEVCQQQEKREAQDAQCTEGSRWKIDCNWCTCSNGIGACTAKLCLPGFKNEGPVCEGDSQWRHRDGSWCTCVDGEEVCQQQEKREAQDAQCTEGSRWKIDCNWCTCSNGLGACTLIGCSPGFRDDGPVCEDRSQWKTPEGASCKCVSGSAICEQASTPNPSFILDMNPAECTEGSRWRKSCNWCSCLNGRGICTKKGCLSEITDGNNECIGESQWRGEDCSWCHCEGGKGVCVRSSCPPPVAAAQPSGIVSPTIALFSRDSSLQKREAICIEGSRWTQLCNWCTCSNGVGLCEQRACLSDSAKDMDKSCEGDSKWKVGCNWCTCENGKGTCTNNDCTQMSGVSNDPVSANDSGCITGNSWLEDCNICICANSTVVCTKKACSSQLRSIQCTEGDVWKDDCNSCRCINGEAACTKKLCPSARDNVEFPALCHLPPVKPDVKLCGGFETKWTFNAVRGKCEEVVYGGCGGTDNLFSNERECQITCGSQEPELKMAKMADNSKERCSLPVVPGPCFALKIRYAFFPERNRCEKFHYGGCQGNMNNFQSVNECYNICGGNPPVLDPECDRNKCDWKRFGHYLGQDCDPVYDDGSCCPSRFQCKSEEERGRDISKCYYKGKEYAIGDNVPVDDECSAGCKCLERGSEKLAEITCASVECPSLFRRPNPGCRLLYTPGQCCETDRECVDPLATPPQVDQRSSECHWKNESWKLGDKMFFHDEPCKKCICTNEFTDPDGPGCKPINCGFDFKYRTNYREGCVPLYFEERCCSIDWICPGDRRLENAEVQPTTNPIGDASKVCTLGDLTVPVGGSTKLSDCQIKCDCKTPPGLTCVKYRTCELAEQSHPQNLRVADLSIPTTSFSCKEPTCPSSCFNPTTVFDHTIGCNVCKCECRKGFMGKPPCPMDCAVKIIFDKETGCDTCVCNTNISVNPFSKQ